LWNAPAIRVSSADSVLRVGNGLRFRVVNLLLGRPAVLLDSFLVILRNAPAMRVPDAELALRLGVSLFCQCPDS
jgi:hypothetical protein